MADKEKEEMEKRMKEACGVEDKEKEEVEEKIKRGGNGGR